MLIPKNTTLRYVSHHCGITDAWGRQTSFLGILLDLVTTEPRERVRTIKQSWDPYWNKVVLVIRKNVPSWEVDVDNTHLVLSLFVFVAGREEARAEHQVHRTSRFIWAMRWWWVVPWVAQNRTWTCALSAISDWRPEWTTSAVTERSVPYGPSIPIHRIWCWFLLATKDSEELTGGISGGWWCWCRVQIICMKWGSKRCVSHGVGEARRLESNSCAWSWNGPTTWHKHPQFPTPTIHSNDHL